MTAVVITVKSAARATAESTTSSRSVFLVRHVAAAASKTREVDAVPAACDRKSSPGT
jgi:hypothetical protein